MFLYLAVIPVSSSAEEVSLDPTVTSTQTQHDLANAPLLTEKDKEKLEECYQNNILICEKDYEQCTQEPDTIHVGLNACYQAKISCLKTCKRNYKICCNRDGTPECDKECYNTRQLCDASCEENGTQCTLTAITAKPIHVEKPNCEERFKQCKKVVKELCLEGL